MPSTYAHYRMGQGVRKSLHGQERNIIEKYPELYLIGLHGPDLFFYYKPLSPHPVNQIGYGLHRRSGKEFFEYGAEVIRKQKDKEPYLAYLYGVINHFAMDVTCHGYVNKKIRESGISHAEIEAEFDRELMVRDGKNPVRHSLTGHIHPTIFNAEVISAFYGISGQEVLHALRGMIFYSRVLLAPGRVKRGMVSFMLKVSGNYREMHGMMINREKNPACADSTMVLMKLYGDAGKLAVRLVKEYAGFLAEKKPLDPVYSRNFEGENVGGEKLS